MSPRGTRYSRRGIGDGRMLRSRGQTGPSRLPVACRSSYQRLVPTSIAVLTPASAPSPIGQLHARRWFGQ